MSVERTPVVVIEPVEILRAGLTTLVNCIEGYEVVASCASAEEYLSLNRRRDRIAIMDHPMRGPSGCSFELLHGHFPHLRILALAQNGSPGGMRAAFRSDALGYLPHTASTLQLGTALDELRIKGHYYYEPYVGACITLTDGELSTPRLKPHLLKVLELMADLRGLTDAQIADESHYTTNTVADYVHEIKEALGAKNRTAAVLLGILEGHIPMPERPAPDVDPKPPKRPKRR